MRLSLVALLLFAAACTTDAQLCSEDPDCQPAGCGPSGCNTDGGSAGRGGTGGAGGIGGSGGTAGSGGSGGTAVVEYCDDFCNHVYFTCSMWIGGPGGGSLSHDQCLAVCEQGVPSRAQAECAIDVPCGMWNECLQPVPDAVCDLVCAKVYEQCSGALIVDGALLSPSDCPLACPDGLSNRQAACIANADCANWTACAP